MKYHAMTKFSDETDWEGVVFFAQLMREMLYDYTLDTYKPSALSPRMLCVEAIKTIDLIENGHVERGRLFAIFDELKWVISGDLVCKNLIEFSVDYYLRLGEKDSLEHVRNRLNLLANRLTPEVFLPEAERCILEVMTSPKEKNRLRGLARSWVSTMICVGFHKSLLEEKVIDFFFDEQKSLKNISEVEDFFSCIERSAKSYEIVFGVSSLFSEISERCAEMSCELHEKNPYEGMFDDGRVALWDGTHKFLLVKEIVAYDKYSARDFAERRIELLSDLFVLFHHKERLTWENLALVRKIDEQLVSVVEPPRSPLKKTSDFVPRRASQRLGEVMSRLSLRDSKASTKFGSIVRLHGAATSADSPETQLVNLWTAMEVVIPPGKGPKLKNVTDAIMPFLLCTYIDNIFYNLAGDILRWNRNGLWKILKTMNFPSALKLHHKVALVVLCKAHEEVMGQLYDLIGGFPLLRYRVYSIQQRFKDGACIKKAIEQHRQRVEWQIARIYRARNLIIHNGSAPSIVENLAENAHAYLDAFISGVMGLSMDNGRAQSIDEATTLMTERCARWLSLLPNFNGIDESSVRLILTASQS